MFYGAEVDASSSGSAYFKTTEVEIKFPRGALNTKDIYNLVP